jgi:hypothetical protein
MRFTVRSDRRVTVVFEPTAQEYTLAAGEAITVEWSGKPDSGMIELAGGEIVIQAPTAGCNRA